MRRRRNKYGNIPTIIDGIRFASKKEAARWPVLQAMQAKGEILNLRRQVSHTLRVNGELICRYVSDYEYDLPDGTHIVEDVKGRLTDVYKLKRKLMKALFGIVIKET